MKIRDLINDDFTYKWDVIEKIPEFAVLKTCEQNPRWHSEGNVWCHTKNVCDEALKMVRNDELDYNFIFLAAALFHDIGKGVTTRLGKDGNWHSYGHEVEGEKLTRYLLFDEDLNIRESVCGLVRWHMEPLHIFDHKNWITDVLAISQRCIWKLLIALEKCDCLGSKKSEEESKRSLDMEILSSLENVVHSIGCYFGPSDIPYIKRDIPCEKMKRKRDVGEPIRVIVLIGIAGAGKSTFAEKFKTSNSVVLSRDAIRADLGYCKEGEKVILSSELEDKVTTEFIKRMIAAAEEGKDIIIDNLNTKKKYRDTFKHLLKKYNVFWDYIYIQAPSFKDNVKRRKGVIGEEVLKNMVLNIEWPEKEEYDKMICYISK